MKLIPQIAADIDDYPELRTLADAALRRVAELMSIHAIVEIRRIYKKGVFDRQYAKDVVTPINLQEVPHTVRAGQHAAGKALLDYLEAIGMTGLQLEITQEDAKAIASLWMPPAEPEPMPTDDLSPRPADDAEPQGGDQDARDEQPGTPDDRKSIDKCETAQVNKNSKPDKAKEK